MRKAIIIDVTFKIDGKTLFYEGKAYPDVYSGSYFGGMMEYEKGKIEEVINDLKKWFSVYGRKIIIKKKIIREGNLPSLFDFETW